MKIRNGIQLVNSFLMKFTDNLSCLKIFITYSITFLRNSQSWPTLQMLIFNKFNIYFLQLIFKQSLKWVFQSKNIIYFIIEKQRHRNSSLIIYKQPYNRIDPRNYVSQTNNRRLHPVWIKIDILSRSWPKIRTNLAKALAGIIFGIGQYKAIHINKVIVLQKPTSLHFSAVIFSNHRVFHWFKCFQF